MATITGNLVNIIDEAVATRLLVRLSSGVVLASKTVVRGAVAFNSDETGAFELTGIQPGTYEVLIGEDDPEAFWITVVDASTTYAWEDVQTAAPTPPTEAGILATKQYVQTLLAGKMDKAPAAGTWRINDLGHFQFWNPTTLKWHTPYPDGPEGAVHTAWGPGEG
jgi:phage-related tail fiber protein